MSIKGERFSDLLRAKNWGDFQHYKDRAPTWIAFTASCWMIVYSTACRMLAGR